MSGKSLKKLSTFIVALYLAKKGDKRITLGFFVNTEHKVWNNNHKKQTLHIGNKHHNDASNDTFELSQSSRNQIIRLHIKPMTPLSKNKKFIQR